MSGPENNGTFIDYFYILVSILFVLFGGFCIFQNILICMTGKLKSFQFKKNEHQIRSFAVVVISMTFISVTNIWMLFTCYYPGTLTPDSIWQIEQCISNVYSNHHPFYHTIIIKLFLSIGSWIFHDINKVVALYCVFQIILMAGVFSFTIVTLYQMRLSYKWILLCQAWYMMMPYHIMYSFTMWKDVLFGGMVAVFITASFRILRGIGKNRIINNVMAFLGSMGVCLLRSNGWFAFFLTAVVFTIVFWKKQKKMIGMFASVLFLSFLLLHPVLEYLGVTEPDTIEALSVPAQQVARVITDCNDITKEQRELLNEIVKTEEIPDVYLSYISDPVKQKVRETNRQDYLKEHRLEYLNLWFEIGITHPHKYIEAWIDLTKGYWNGGYAYGIWSFGIGENNWGITADVHSWRVRRIMNDYFWLYNNMPLFQVFISIGFHVWLVVLVGLSGVLMKRKEVAFLTVPLMAIIFSLLIATPVFAEFRYAYAVFTSIPMVLFAAFDKWETDSS